MRAGAQSYHSLLKFEDCFLAVDNIVVLPSLFSNVSGSEPAIWYAELENNSGCY